MFNYLIFHLLNYICFAETGSQARPVDQEAWKARPDQGEDRLFRGPAMDRRANEQGPKGKLSCEVLPQNR